MWDSRGSSEASEARALSGSGCLIWESFKTHITVTRIAPMGDPVEVFLRGYTLSLRLEDAAKVEVELA